MSVARERCRETKASAPRPFPFASVAFAPVSLRSTSVVLAVLVMSCAAVLARLEPVAAAPSTAGAASDRTVVWIKASEVVALTDGQLDEWGANGVGGFVMMAGRLPGLGGTSQSDLTTTIVQTNLVKRLHERGMRIYWGFKLANYNDSRAPLAGWFDDAAWANVALPAISDTAGTANRLGFDGVALDAEMYAGRDGSATWDWDFPGNTVPEAEVRAQAERRGTQVMQSLLRAFPRVTMVIYGIYFPDSWWEKVQTIVNDQPDAAVRTVQPDFWDGMTSVDGYGTITFLDATFYKTTHVKGVSWDTAFEYNESRVEAFWSRAFSNWDYASSRLEIVPFVWIDSGTTAFQAARPPAYVAEQLAAAHRWGGTLFGVYLQQPFPAEFDSAYVDGLRQAARPQIVDATRPSLSIRGFEDRGDVRVDGTAADNFAVRAVRWRTSSGMTGTAAMSWVQTGGGDSEGYDWRIDWNAVIPAGQRGQPIVFTAEDSNGLTRTLSARVPRGPVPSVPTTIRRP